MIIGLTIHDNDYTKLMEGFTHELGIGKFIMESPPKDDMAWFNWWKTTSEACRAAVKAEKPTDEQKELMRDTVQRSWRAYIKPYHNDYLTDILEITFPEHIDSAWQNGEQYYVFPTSYYNNVLCF